MDRKAGKCRVGGKTAGEKISGEKNTDEKGPAGRAAAAERGAGAQGTSTGGLRSRSQQESETAARPTAAPVAGEGCPRQRGRDEGDRQRGCNDLAFRALCDMGFRAHQARRALGIVGQRRAGSLPSEIGTLLREALAVLAP
jgi:hypothetical protein